MIIWPGYMALSFDTAHNLSWVWPSSRISSPETATTSRLITFAQYQTYACDQDLHLILALVFELSLTSSGTKWLRLSTSFSITLVVVLKYVNLIQLK